MVRNPSLFENGEEYPRPKLETAVIEILSDCGRLDTREIAQELFKRDVAYTVIDGTKCPIGLRSLHSRLNSFWHIEQDRRNNWRYKD